MLVLTLLGLLPQVTVAFGTSPFVLAAALLGALGGIFIIAGLVALRRARPLRFALRTLAGLLLLSLGGFVGAIGVGMNGYRALTREDVAARIVVRPVGPQRFAATFLVADRPERTYELAGDGIYVDAHILKLRQKLEPDPNIPRHILTVHGVGYRFLP